VAFINTIGSDALQPKVGATEAPAYVYKHFKSHISASKAAGYISGSSSLMSLELQSAGLDFAGATNSVDSSTYVTTINGNVDAQAARTPWITSQGPSVNLFRVYMRVDGAASNGHYAVISDVKKPANSNSSPDYAMFSLSLYTTGGNLLETYNNLNLDPTSANYVAKVIGDQFQTVTSAGEVVTHGEFVNKSKYMRIIIKWS